MKARGINLAAERGLSVSALQDLDARGIRVIGQQAVPAFDGDRYFTGSAYVLDDNGTQRVLRLHEVLALAEHDRQQEAK